MTICGDCFSGWRASTSSIGVVMSVHLAYYAIIATLIFRLSNSWKEKPVEAAATVNTLAGMTAVMAIIGAILADACLGRYRTVIFSTGAYVIGLGLLTLSVSKDPKAPNSRVSDQEFSVFYVALILVAMGMGGLQSTLKAFGADQFKDAKGNLKKCSCFYLNVWWWIGSASGTVAGMILLVPTKWSPVIGYGIVTGIMFLSFLSLICGTRENKSSPPGGGLFKVLVAATWKRHLELPSDPNQLHQKDGKTSVPLTNKLRWLGKAAIVESSGAKNIESSGVQWRLCTVSEVEESKALLQTLPIWITLLVYGMVMSMKISFFLLQARIMTKGPLRLLLTFLVAFAALSSFAIGKFFECCCMPLLQRFGILKGKLRATKRIGVGMFFSLLCCITAALVESKRKEKHLNFFWLLPQFFLLGAMDDFVRSGLMEFYEQLNKQLNDEATEGFSPPFFEGVIGLGSFFTSILVAITDRITQARGYENGRGWFSDTINNSRLDYFYWTLAALSVINLCFYGHFSWTYTHNKARTGEEGSTKPVNAGSKGACACWK